VKKQQIFYSFLPGVTVAVLTTQPAWAYTAKSDGVQQFVPSGVSTFTTVGEKVQNLNIPLFATGEDSLQPWFGNDTNAAVTGKTGIPSQLLQKKNWGSLNFAYGAAVTNKEKQKYINLQTDNRPSQIQTSVSTYVSKQQRSPLASVTTSIADTQKETIVNLSNFLQKNPRHFGTAKMLKADNCQQQTVTFSNSSCPQTNYLNQLVSQAATPLPSRTSTPPPGYLNPNPNPLQFPTKPEEVRIKGTQPITLQQAIELARRNNRDLQVALLQLERAQSALREAQAALFPNLGLNAQIARQQSASAQLATERQKRAEAGLPPELRSPSQDQASTAFTGAAQLSYSLYTSGRRLASIRAAEEQVRFQQLDIERLSEQIRLNVSTSYYDLQQADENVRIQQAAVKNAEASLRDAQALERAGVGTRFDVLRAQVNLANSQQNLVRALSQQRIASARLGTLLSIPGSISISAADPVALAGLWNQTLEQSIILAFQNRPELQQFLAQRNISEQRRRLALSDLGPQLSIVASYNLLDQFNDSISVTDGYSIGLQANLTLFDGGAAKARAAQERANIRIAETQFSQQREQIRFQVEQAYSNLQANLENVQTANAALEQARESLRLARLRFQAGVGTQTDVIAAETDLTTAEGNRVAAILDYNRALVSLQQAVSTRALR
jgi:OMF family outer membrane factor